MNRALLEKDIKKMVRRELKKIGVVSATEIPTSGSTGWYYMPVQSGMGMSKIADFVGQYKGRFFAIETKAPGKECTGLQGLIGKNINTTGGFWCVVDSEEAMKAFLAWTSRKDKDKRQIDGTLPTKNDTESKPELSDLLYSGDGYFCLECKSLLSFYEQGLCCDCGQPWDTEVLDKTKYPEKWVRVCIEAQRT